MRLEKVFKSSAKPTMIFFSLIPIFLSLILLFSYITNPNISIHHIKIFIYFIVIMTLFVLIMAYLIAVRKLYIYEDYFVYKVFFIKYRLEYKNISSFEDHYQRLTLASNAAPYLYIHSKKNIVIKIAMTPFKDEANLIKDLLERKKKIKY